jgi:hypothetical protein
MIVTTRRHPRGRDVPDALIAHLASVGSMTVRSEPSGRRRLERAVGRELADALVGALAGGRGHPRGA